MLRAIVFILILSFSVPAFASLIIKGQIRVKNLQVNTSASQGGGGGEDIGALLKEDGGQILKEDGGVLLYD